MKYEAILKKEKGKWFDIETTIGNDTSLIDRYLKQLNKLFASFSDQEVRQLEKILKIKEDDFIGDPYRLTKKQIKLLLLWRFTSKNNLRIMGEVLNISKEGRELEKGIFLKLAKDLFTKNSLPHKVYAYCAFRKMGSPTTWLYFHNSISERKIRRMLNQDAVSSICRHLTRKRKQSARLRITELIDKNILFFIAKSADSVLVKGQKNNKEAQKAVYSLLILDLEKKRVGIISRSKIEIGLIHRYLKTRIFPDQLRVPRTDRECNPATVFNSLIEISKKNPAIEILKLDLKHSCLPDSPAIQLKSSNGKSINEAIFTIGDYYKGVGINDLKSIEYTIKDQRANVYSYGPDAWKRRYLNVSSRGKLCYSEKEILEELEQALGYNIKETRFLIEKLSEHEVIQKIMREKRVAIEPPVPEYVEKIVTELVERKLLKAPKKACKRICEDLTCSTSSWTSWVCPKCGREMALFGEEITIDLNEPSFNKILASKLQEKFPNFEILKRLKQRGRYKKSLVHAVDQSNQLGYYIVPVLSRKDITFLRALSQEGSPLIALCHPQLESKKTEISGIGCHFLSLDMVLDNLKQETENENSSLETLLSDAFEKQRKQTLERVYAKLQSSEESLRKKEKGYNENTFEIDIKSILQALVPKVVRLGAEYSGQSLPDGYCSFHRDSSTKNYIFGWDAKFSATRNYKLAKSDFTKQKKYIKWLSEAKEPKDTGKLWIYAIVSNFDTIDNYRSVLGKLSRYSEKPRNCKIMLLEDDLLVKLADWILNHWADILSKGPEISKTFFKWIRSKSRKQSGRWIYINGTEWPELESEIEKL